MNTRQYNKLSDLEKELFGDLYKPNKRQTYTLKFTHRQLELLMYACDLSISDRRQKDANTLYTIMEKVEKLNIDNLSTEGID